MEGKVQCICGKIVNESYYPRHIDSTAHKNFIAKNSPKIKLNEENVFCECNCLVSKKKLEEHKQSDFHIEQVKLIELNKKYLTSKEKNIAIEKLKNFLKYLDYETIEKLNERVINENENKYNEYLTKNKDILSN